jgi:dTDP-4-amino-4,6-dideoxygalactose transaminase
LIIKNVINDSAFIGFDNNPYLCSFEANFAKYLGAKYCLGLANGTDAIELSLIALGINPGDEIIIPTHTWISTAEAVSYIGAKPVFVDTEDNYYTIDPNLIRKKVTSKTKAIVAVHLFGQPCNMDLINEIALEFNLKVIEDCAQAQGAEYKTRKVGTIGDIGCFSFFPGKNLGAFGDAGCIVTDDDSYFEKIRMLRNHGQSSKNLHKIIGRNSRLDGLNAAILDYKLKYLDELNSKRISNAAYFLSKLQNISGIELPVIRENAKHVFHQFIVRVDDRDNYMDKMKTRGIETSVHYPNILPNTEVYHATSSDSFFISNHYIERIVSIPIDPLLTEEELNYISDTTIEILS